MVGYTGSTHSYSYRAETTHRIVGTSTVTSGVQLTASISSKISQNRNFAEITVTNAEMSPILPQSSSSSSKSFSELNNSPIGLKLDNGRIIEIYSSMDETEEIRNIKRGIASAFQVTVSSSDRDGTSTIEETDVLGTCETLITQSSKQGNVFVTKHRNTESCSTHCSSCRVHSEHYESTFISGSMNAEYNVNSDGIIQSAVIEQVEKVTPLSADAGTILTTIRQSLKWTGVTRGGQSHMLCTGGSPITFAHSCTCASHTGSDCQSDVTSLIKKMSTSSSSDIPALFLDLIKLMRTCSKSSLEDLSNSYVQSSWVDDEFKMREHTYFLDALAYAGTEPSMDVIVDLVNGVSSVSVSGSRASELTLSLSFLPIHTSCPCSVLERSLAISQASPTDMVPKLVVGAVVNKVLSSSESSCGSLVTEALQFLTTQLSGYLSLLPGSFDNAMHSIKALGNAGAPQTLQTLISAWKNPQLQTEGRAAAIYALRSMSRRIPVAVRWQTLKLYSNTHEEADIRIAAFLTFMSTVTHDTSRPTTSEMKTLMGSVHNEPNSYVKSFVCTYFMAVERSEDPSIRTLREMVSYHLQRSGLVLVCSAADTGYSSSRSSRGHVSLADASLSRSLPHDVMGIGFSSGVLSSDKSWLPHSASGKVTANVFGYNLELLEVGGYSTGLQELMSHLFGPTGYLRKGTRTMGPSTSGSGRDLPPITINVPEDMSLSGYLKVLGQEVGWTHWDQDYLMESLYGPESLTKLRETITDTIFGRLDFSDVLQIVDKIEHYFHAVWKGETDIWHGKHSVTKCARVLDVKCIIPTIIGMPLNLEAKTTGHLHLDAKEDVSFKTLSLPERIKRHFFSSSSTEQNQYDTIHSEVLVSPKLSLLSMATLSLCAYHYEPKLVFKAKADSSFEQQIQASLENRGNKNCPNQFSNWVLSVEVLELPDSTTSLLDSWYTQFAEVDGSQFSISVDKHSESMIYEPIHSELLGLTLSSNVWYPDSTEVDQAPFFPLSGSAKFDLSLKRDDSSSATVKFQISDQQKPCNSLDQGRYDFDLSVVKSGTSYSGIWGHSEWYIDASRDPPRKVVQVDLSSSPTHFTSRFSGNTKKRVDIEGSATLQTSVSKTRADLKFTRSHFSGELSHTRPGPETWELPDSTMSEPIISIPEFSVKVEGSLANNAVGSTSVALTKKGWEEPHWLEVEYNTKGLLVDISATSSLFNDDASLFAILPHPLKSPICHVFDGCGTHVITFDDSKHIYELSSSCEYILARHRHENHTFAVTKEGKSVNVYINGITYTLSPEHTTFEINGVSVPLPHKEKHVIHVRKITRGGQQYTRLSAWAGVDIWYTHGNIQLAVNGYFMNELAGLCGNANYNPDDDLIAPDLSEVGTEEVMASTWTVSSSCDRSTTSSSKSCPSTDTVDTCDLYLSDVLSAAHQYVGVDGFVSACYHDVGSCCQSPFSSISAYITGAHAKQVDIDGSFITACVYGRWSEWSECDFNSHLQQRTRSVLHNPLSHVCDKMKEWKVCVTSANTVKTYALIDWGNNKRCRSSHPVVRCAPQCSETVTGQGTLEEFKCIGYDEPDERFENVSPIYLQYSPVVSCSGC
jgi:hypothetical protein